MGLQYHHPVKKRETRNTEKPVFMVLSESLRYTYLCPADRLLLDRLTLGKPQIVYMLSAWAELETPRS